MASEETPNSPGHTTEDSLIALVHGLSAPAVAAAVLAHVHGCTACEERMRVIAAERERLIAAPQSQIAHGRVVLPGTGRDTSPARRHGRRWFLAAGVAAAAAAMVLLLVGPNPSRDPLEYWLPIEREQALLRSGDANRKELDVLSQAFASYDDHDAKRVLELLGDRDFEEPIQSLRLLYLASAQIHVGAYQPALRTLEQLGIESMPQPWRRRALWMKYVALTRTGEIAAARAVLEPLALEPGDIGERAKREIERLNAPNR